MTTTGWLPAPTEDLFGAEATAEESYDVLTVDVPPTSWTAALETARDRLHCTYFDWLSAVDEPGTGFRVAAHVVALSPVRRLLVRTTVPHESAVLPSLVDVYAGAAWHERETHEMFGVRFEGHPGLDHLLLPETFEGHPLRKDFVLAARVAKAWPGAKEPGESAAGAAHGGPKRRQMLPPGVPDPNEWGPLKGQLPPAPTRPARAAAGRATGDRPVRRTRTASDGSVGQTPETPTPEARTPAPEGTLAPTPPSPPTSSATPRRARSASQGSASQRPRTPAPEAPQPGATEAPRPPATDVAEATAATGPQSPGPHPPGSEAKEAETVAADTTPKPPTTAPRATDAPWHHARPTFDEPTPNAAEPTEPPASEASDPEGPTRDASPREDATPEAPDNHPTGGSQ
ncbi:NADH-quinone oxidoreductase subunit C [Streptomyces sp. AK08-02]|uniref:NADH-quinone oxidoreductase subunit C n=1 Tax=Streptomyces sp. AK08-02 TaxID=3028654 RepID=UPI0029A65A52|nr:NADH-quinone oxidoreductase subunit C [Streptomyces sp. AK08-02]MDX3747770.1 NADH-quinone oxidoreductase subunit C [Streptomyces sp. AK08-02]